MKVIVMGCGRVGEAVSTLLAEDGHDVTVIDKDAKALARLGARFRGHTVRGVGFDRDVLIEAGIQRAEAFAATSASDSVNIVAARVARNMFSVPRVVARLFDPRRAEIYQRLGLVTMSSTEWGAGRIRELLTHDELDPVLTLGNGEAKVMSIEVPTQLVGRMVRDLTVAGELIVVSITRSGMAFLPMLGTEFRRGDLLHLAASAAGMQRIESLLGISR